MSAQLGPETVKYAPASQLEERAKYWEREAEAEEGQARAAGVNPRLTVFERQRVVDAYRHNASLARGRAKSERRAWVDRVLAEVGEALVAAAEDRHTVGGDYDLAADVAETAREIAALRRLGTAVIEVQAYVMGKL